MSSVTVRQRKSPVKPARQPPYIGALLRLCSQSARQRIMAELAAAGFADLHPAHLSVLQYPPPEGVRPSELAERAAMTKQAMNHLLGQMEALDYIDRRVAKGSTRRLVYITRRAAAALDIIYATMGRLEAEWAMQIGEKRFDALLETLRELAGLPK